MIIQAKAARQGEAEKSGQDAGLAEAKFSLGEKFSRLPMIFAGVATLVAAYFQNFFVAAQSQTAPQKSDAGSDTAEGDPESGEVAAKDGVLKTAKLDEPGQDAVSSAQGAFALSPQHWSTGLFPLDQPGMAFTRAHVPAESGVQAFFPAAFSLGFSNDNRSRLQSAPEMGGAPAAPSKSVAGPAPAAPAMPVAPAAPEAEIPEAEIPEAGPNTPPPTPHQANRAPVVAGPVFLRDILAGQAVLVGLAHLLTGASDPDGDVLRVTDLTISGATLATFQNGWTVAAAFGTLGPVTLSYSISDGVASVRQTAHIEIVRNQMVLTDHDDLAVGTPYDDDIDGGAGHDIIDAMAGYDLVSGGLGDDHIMGGAGNDHLYGGAGNDVLFGGLGNDRLSGGAGDDRLFGDEGDDVLAGDAGADHLYGGAGDDILDGGAGNDHLDGEDGNDTIEGGAGNDRLYGAAGRDSLAGGLGNDHLDGGIGDDVLLGGAGTDTLLGQDGNDTLDGGIGNDHLEGGIGDDVLLGGAGTDTLLGQDGNDTLDGGIGNDHLDAGAGNDTILAGQGSDTIDGGAGEDILDYSASEDSVIIDTVEGAAHHGEDTDSFADIEHLIGSAQDDIFVLSANLTVSVQGGRGRDLFVFEAADDSASMSEDIVHEILDFMIGDRVRVREYDTGRSAERAERDYFESIYGNDDVEHWLRSDLPILVTYERYDDVDHTVILADMNRDSIYEVTIDIHGVHLAMPGHTEMA